MKAEHKEDYALGYQLTEEMLRELAHKDIGLRLLKRVESDLADIASVEQATIAEGRQFVMLLSPNKK